MVKVAPITIERPFDCTRIQTLANILGHKRVPLRVLFQNRGCCA